MLSRFSNEVLSRGPRAVLPQNLNAFWLKTLQQLAGDFLDANFTIDQCTAELDMEDPILVSCVHEVLGDNRNMMAPEKSTQKLAENVTIYALSITMETIRRESDIEMALPTLENLLSIDRIIRFGQINPKFAQFLEQACIISEDATSTEKGWFKQLKKKILSGVVET